MAWSVLGDVYYRVSLPFPKWVDGRGCTSNVILQYLVLTGEAIFSIFIHVFHILVIEHVSIMGILVSGGRERRAASRG